MKWFKHDSDANGDRKLQELILDYGAEGYGLYWYCVELIAGRVNQDNITFELENDARIIARTMGMTNQRVEDIMQRMIELNLFDISENSKIRCLAIATRLDTWTHNTFAKSSITTDKILSNSSVTNKKLISSSSAEKKRKEKKRKEEREIEPNQDDLALAIKLRHHIQKNMKIKREPNINRWADVFRLMRERDDRTVDGMNNFIDYLIAGKGIWGFWQQNILSPESMRKQYDKVRIQHERSE